MKSPNFNSIHYDPFEALELLAANQLEQAAMIAKQGKNLHATIQANIAIAKQQRIILKLLLKTCLRQQELLQDTGMVTSEHLLDIDMDLFAASNALDEL